jgi:hypothetical protein
MFSNAVRKARIAKLRARTERQSLGELQNLNENPARSLGVNRRRARRQLQVEASSRGKPRKRLSARLALATDVRIDDRTRHPSPARQLRLTEATAAEDLSHSHLEDVSGLANERRRFPAYGPPSADPAVRPAAASSATTSMFSFSTRPAGIDVSPASSLASGSRAASPSVSQRIWRAAASAG